MIRLIASSLFIICSINLFSSPLLPFNPLGVDSMFLSDYLQTHLRTEFIGGVKNKFPISERKALALAIINKLPSSEAEEYLISRELHYSGKVKSTVSGTLDYLSSRKLIEKHPSIQFTEEELVDGISDRILHPKGINQGEKTKFCWAAAFSAFLIQKDPQGIAKSLLDFYETGIWKYAHVEIQPSEKIIASIGTDSFAESDALQHNLADQILLMVLASSYQGYINLDRSYTTGDEHKSVYAGRPIGSFSKMLKDFDISYRAEGADFGWSGKNARELANLCDDNTIFLYVNSNYLFKDHPMALHGSHYVILEDIKISEGQVTFSYWDYGHEEGRKMTLSETKFDRATFGAIIVPNENYQNGLASLKTF